MTSPLLHAPHYLLIDGAQCQDDSPAQALLEDPQAQPLYRDLGAEAAQVGPWLLPANPERLALADACVRSESARFAISYLYADGAPDLPDAQAHLQHLRHVVAMNSSRQRYYLRYADSRAFAALWAALGEHARNQIMGPLSVWSWWDAAGQRCMAIRPALANTPPPPSWPLRLTPAQFKQIIDVARLGELLAMVEEYLPDYLENVPLAQRWAGVRTASQWLAQRAIEPVPVRMAVVAVTLRQTARNLDDPDFEAVVRAAGDTPTAVLAWQPAAEVRNAQAR